MNEPLWEDQLHDLHRLADQVSAPASVEARQAIHRRAGVLRRRRQVRRTVAASALVVLLVAGILALQGRGRTDLETGPAQPAGEGSLPALTLDLDGWDVVDVTDSSDVAWDAAGSGLDPAMTGRSLQVFRRPGELDGPTVVVEHWAASDVVVAEEGDQVVSVGGGEAFLRQAKATSIVLTWGAALADSHAYLRAFGLTREQVLEFANGLRLKDDDAGGIPAQPDDEFGFEATSLPGGIEEDPVEPLHALADIRQVSLESRFAGTVDIQIDTQGEMAFEYNLGDQFINATSVESTSAVDQPALLFESGGSWSLTWRHDDVATVEVTIQGVERETVGEIIDGLRELSDDEWQDLAARFE